MAGTLIEGGFIRKDNAQPLLHGSGRILAGLAIKSFGAYEDPACLIDKNRDSLHRSGLHQNLETNAAISHNRFAALVALLARFQLGFLDRIGLLELIELFWDAPESAKMIKQQVAVGLDAHRKAPAIELDTDAGSETVEKPDFALGGLGQLQAATGGLNGSQVSDLRFYGDCVRHGRNLPWGIKKPPAKVPVAEGPMVMGPSRDYDLISSRINRFVANRKSLIYKIIASNPKQFGLSWRGLALQKLSKQLFWFDRFDQQSLGVLKMHSFSFDALRKRLFRLNGNLLRKLRQPRQGGINPDYATLGDYYIECGESGKVLERHIDLERLGRKLTKKQ